MSATVQRLGSRLVIGASSCGAALLLYVPAEATATAFHDYYRHLVQPWGRVLVSTAILSRDHLAPWRLGGSALMGGRRIHGG